MRIPPEPRLPPPSEDEPESRQSLEDPTLSPEWIALLAEEEEIEQRAADQTFEVLHDDELNERAAESVTPLSLQAVINILIEHVQSYQGEDTAGVYNALRVMAEATGTSLPVVVHRDITITSPGQLIARITEIANDYRHRENKAIPIFGPTAWDPPSLMHCSLIDGTEFICFNHPSRDPAQDR